MIGDLDDLRIIFERSFASLWKTSIGVG